MNYIDIAVIVLLVLGLIGGLIGKAPKKITAFIFIALAVVIAYFTSNKICGMILGIKVGSQTIEELITTKISEVATKANIPADAVTGLATGIANMLVFWIECFALMLVCAIVRAIINAILFHNAKKHTAVFTLGVFGVLKSAIFTFVLIFPILVMSPVLGQIDSFVSDNEMAQTVAEQVSTSKVVEFGDKLFGKVRFKCLEYTKDEETRYLYDDIEALGKTAPLVKIMAKSSENESMLDNISNLSDDEIREMFGAIDGSETIKEILGGIIDNTNLGIDSENIVYADEAEMLIAVKNLIGKDEDGNVVFNEENLNDDFIDAITKSEIIEVMAKNAEGLLSNVTETAKNDIQDKLQAKLDDNKIDQEKFDQLMKLFNTPTEE